MQQSFGSKLFLLFLYISFTWTVLFNLSWQFEDDKDSTDPGDLTNETCKEFKGSVSRHELPYITLFYRKTELSERLLCSGSIIYQQWILTDAWCADMIHRFMVFNEEKVYAVPLNGKVSVAQEMGVYEVGKTFPGRRNGDETKGAQNWIGLVKLKKNITFDENVKSIDMLIQPPTTPGKAFFYSIPNDKCNNQAVFVKKRAKIFGPPMEVQKICPHCLMAAGYPIISYEGMGMPIVWKEYERGDADLEKRFLKDHLYGVMTMLNAAFSKGDLHVFTAMEHAIDWVNDVISNNTYF